MMLFRGLFCFIEKHNTRTDAKCGELIFFHCSNNNFKHSKQNLSFKISVQFLESSLVEDLLFQKYLLTHFIEYIMKT